MDLAEFGLLIKTLRKGSVDERGNPWTRESLSSRIHLTPDQLGRLERGDRKYLDTQTLMLLAESFNLTNLERQEFLNAALGLPDGEFPAGEDPLERFNLLLKEAGNLQFPALIIDAYGDIVASNMATLSLFGVTPELLGFAGQIPAGHNLINFLYSPHLGCREFLGPAWHKTAAVSVLMFRRSTLRYRHTGYFQYLLAILLREKSFDIDWYSSHRYAPQYHLSYIHLRHDHPRYGPLSYLSTVTVVSTRAGDLNLLIYNPLDAATCAVFRDLTKTADGGIYRFAGWPEKIIPG